MWQPHILMLWLEQPTQVKLCNPTGNHTLPILCLEPHPKVKLCKPHGSGIKSWPDGAQYVGEFQHGLRWGRGVFTSGDVRIVGIWLRDHIVEQLLERIDADGAKYFEGPVSVEQCQELASQHATVLMHTAQGVSSDVSPQSIIYANGESFVGQTDNARRHGHGIYVRADGSLVCGTWEDDELVHKVADTSMSGGVAQNASLQQLRTGNLLVTERQCRHL